MRRLISVFITLLPLSSFGKNASFMREPAQGAVVFDASTALYNPAGSVFLNKGHHISLSSLSLLRKWDIETKDQNYGRDVYVPVVPELNSVWVQDDYSIIANFNVDGGGTTFKDGRPSYTQIMNSTLKSGLAIQEADMKFSDASNVIIASDRLYFFNLGSAFKLSKKVSMALGAKAVLGEKNFDAALTYRSVESKSDRDPLPGVYKLRFREKATGAAPFVAVYADQGKWALASKYDFQVKLPYKVELMEDDLSPISEAANKDAVATDGSIENNDVPAQLTLSGRYQYSESIRLGLTLARTFFQEAKQDTWQKSMKLKREAYNNASIKGKPLLDQNAVSVSLAYVIHPNFTFSSGYVHQDVGSSSTTNVDDQHRLDMDLFSFGFNTRFDNHSIDVALSLIQYEDSYNQDRTQVFGQRDNIFSLGYNLSLAD